ncbi:MAG: D-alanyl-D-alanine carboxypeptidase [Bacteroidaceae bacterium]|nr:D-alanyl-D-alanine carboxypeptidase [Bacteroidaceae bacterium]
MNGFYLVLLALCMFVAPVSAKKQPSPEKKLERDLTAIMHEKMPRASRVGIYVYDLENNTVIFENEPNVMCQPASCQKLLTTITALDANGGSPFLTQFWIKGKVVWDEHKNSILQGDLYVVGGFDPTFTVERMDTIIKSMRISKITGKIYADVSAKDSVSFGPGWWWDDAPYSFQPYVSPLLVEKDNVEVTVWPSTKGRAANVSLKPQSNYFAIENNSVTVHKDSASTVKVQRRWMQNENTIVIEGDVNTLTHKSLSVYASQDMFMNIFLERLRARGVEYGGGYEYAELSLDTVSDGSLFPVTGNPYCLKSPVADFFIGYETPFDSVMVPMLKNSDNLYAECVLMNTAATVLKKKHLSWSEAVVPEKDLAQRLNFESGTYSIKDGSGLSNVDYISPKQMVCLLQYAYNKPKIFDRLYPALPVNGVDGTLKNRITGLDYVGRVHAKTGSLSVASTLAGYVRMRNGRMAAFCIMNQNYSGASSARNLQDALLSYIIDNVK